MSEVKKLLPLLKIHPWIILAIVTLGIFSSLFEGLGISLFIPLIHGLESPNSSLAINNKFLLSLDNLFDIENFEKRLLLIACVILVAILLKSILNYSSNVIFSWYNQLICHRLRSDIFNQLLKVSYSFLNSQDSGKLINTLASETWRVNNALAVLFELIITVCTITIFVTLLLLISWKLTLLVTVALCLISYCIRLTTRKSRAIGKKAVAANEFLTQIMLEGYGGMKIIRYFGRENYEQANFVRASNAVKNHFFQMDILSRVVNPLSESLSSILIVGMLVISLRQNSNALPMLLTFMFILYRLQPKVRQLDTCRVNLSTLTSSVETVLYFLDRTDKSYIHSGKVPFKKLETAIIFEDVDFSYQLEEKIVLQDISLTIPQGKTTALVGTSGSGKSTIINLIYRFYEPERGIIKVDGCPLAQLNLKNWRSRLAIVSQDVYLFSTTIKENIAYGCLNATEAEIINAAKLAHADEFISQFPDGYSTKVGDRGVRLSGGQKQRIALARAIVSQPEILILDEATNALDSISENLIQEAIQTLSKNCTVIVVAHRLSTIEQAEQIIVLNEGKVVEQGNLESLLQLKGLFYQMYSLQNRHSLQASN